MARILGIDVGERRIGLAISTPEQTLAVPLRVIESHGDADDARAITGVAREQDAALLVVGHPISMSGDAGPQARRIEAFARTLSRESGLQVELWDERLSSAQVERARRGTVAKKKRSAPADDLVAAVVLQGYLDRQQGAPPS